MYEKGFIDGIEVVNFSDFCPEAWEWAKEKDLTILSNSDMHSTTQMSKFESHRPITLVFASDFSESSLKEALESKQTALFYDNCIYGEESIISELLNNSLRIEKRYDKENEKIFYDIYNLSSAPVILYGDKSEPKYALPKRLQIDAKSGVHFYISTKQLDGETVKFNVGNFYTGPDQQLDFYLAL
jgi:hypothetical protein